MNVNDARSVSGKQDELERATKGSEVIRHLDEHMKDSAKTLPNNKSWFKGVVGGLGLIPNWISQETRTVLFQPSVVHEERARSESA